MVTGIPEPCGPLPEGSNDTSSWRDLHCSVQKWFYDFYKISTFGPKSKKAKIDSSTSGFCCWTCTCFFYFDILSFLLPTYCLFTHFSARCKILFWVDTPWKSLCRSISTWYTGHNLNIWEQLYTILCLLLCAISYFLLYLLTDYHPEYSLYIPHMSCYDLSENKAICIVL